MLTKTVSDRNQLTNMANQARDAIGTEELSVVADREYFQGEEIVACEAKGINTHIPKPLTSSAKSDGRFSKKEFIYVPALQFSTLLGTMFKRWPRPRKR